MNTNNYAEVGDFVTYTGYIPDYMEAHRKLIVDRMKIDNSYKIMNIVSNNDIILYKIIDKYDIPYWVPSECFDQNIADRYGLK